MNDQRPPGLSRSNADHGSLSRSNPCIFWQSLSANVAALCQSGRLFCRTDWEIRIVLIAGTNASFLLSSRLLKAVFRQIFYGRHCSRIMVGRPWIFPDVSDLPGPCDDDDNCLKLCLNWSDGTITVAGGLSAISAVHTALLRQFLAWGNTRVPLAYPVCPRSALLRVNTITVRDLKAIVRARLECGAG